MNLHRRSFFCGLGARLVLWRLRSCLPTTSRGSRGRWLPSRPCCRRAKNVIMLFMEGGPGHMDTFDPKPELTRLHKEESKLAFGQETGFKFFVGSPFSFRQVSDTGLQMCDQWKHLADPYVADELCNYRGCQAESLNHPEALFHMNTGSRLGEIRRSVPGPPTALARKTKTCPATW